MHPVGLMPPLLNIPDHRPRGQGLLKLALWPSLAFFLLFPLLQTGGLDEWLSSQFYSRELAAFPLQNNFWTRDVLHHGGRSVMLGVLALIALLWLLAFRVAKLKPWKRDLGYLLLAILISVLLVNVGKRISNVDCPWDLEPFGGTRPHISLFAAKPADIPPGRCFPGGHSSGGFALFALYFVARRRKWKYPALSLAPGLLIGGTFSVAQWMRGAHFPSHDLTTAWLCWIIALLCSQLLFGMARPNKSTRSPGSPDQDHGQQ